MIKLLAQTYIPPSVYQQTVRRQNPISLRLLGRFKLFIKLEMHAEGHAFATPNPSLTQTRTHSFIDRLFHGSLSPLSSGATTGCS